MLIITSKKKTLTKEHFHSSKDTGLVNGILFPSNTFDCYSQ